MLVGPEGGFYVVGRDVLPIRLADGYLTDKQVVFAASFDAAGSSAGRAQRRAPAGCESMGCGEFVLEARAATGEDARVLHVRLPDGFSDKPDSARIDGLEGYTPDPTCNVNSDPDAGVVGFAVSAR